METNNCIKNLLKLICVLQNNSKNLTCLDEGCTKPFLGPSVTDICYNTRVITLYNKQGTLFSANYFDNDVINSSSIFRVLNVTDDCCTLLILNNIDGEFFSTKQSITVKLSCICAVKCLEDAVVSNL